MYFTRDQGACVGSGISIHHMHTATRRRESLLLKYIYRFSPNFATPDNPMWFDYDDPHSIEGGDILVLSDKICAVGLSREIDCPRHRKVHAESAYTFRLRKGAGI
jgi:arginine deiminase